MYEKGPDNAELAYWGLTLEDVGDSAFEVWPQNMRAVDLLITLSTQWRTGAVGATGLDYSVLPTVFRLAAIPRSEWADTFECLRILESEVLSILSEARNG